ncbi:hypothetical protein PPTG_17859 [Phytophthora nicotianae INRA-310]|uniref:Uncharacterized protein n=1 Tax=Phytophthora nicotianae (strain INRA-310) TaxID=761204 RepID=W2PK80_PHYN3|nr:hypothetical protein PPTG_17859 [Phytophthora nicotianae INRA-310]ETN00654.1 hypothetical protein PPTG_17859 [Phytophthora nicotianae INRA-310]
MDEMMSVDSGVDAVMECMKADALKQDDGRARRYVCTVRPTLAMARFVRVAADAVCSGGDKDKGQRGTSMTHNVDVTKDESSGEGDGIAQTFTTINEERRAARRREREEAMEQLEVGRVVRSDEARVQVGGEPARVSLVQHRDAERKGVDNVEPMTDSLQL